MVSQSNVDVIRGLRIHIKEPSHNFSNMHTCCLMSVKLANLSGKILFKF